MSRFAINCLCPLKQTIHEATFVTGDKATLSFVHAAHEISHGTFYKSLGNRRAVQSQATCGMQHSIFPCATSKNNNVGVSPVTKVALCMVVWLQPTPTILWPKIQRLYHAKHMQPCIASISTTCKSLVYMSHASTCDIRRTVDGKPGHHSNLNVLNLLWNENAKFNDCK